MTSVHIQAKKGDEMSVVIRYYGLMGQAVMRGDVPVGAYLAEYDVERHDGRGFARWTTDVNEAIKFANIHLAMQAWKKQSMTRPLRPDGKPNRPLSAFSVSIEGLTDA